MYTQMYSNVLKCTPFHAPLKQVSVHILQWTVIQLSPKWTMYWNIAFFTMTEISMQVPSLPICYKILLQQFPFAEYTCSEYPTNTSENILSTFICRSHDWEALYVTSFHGWTTCYNMANIPHQTTCDNMF